MTKNDPTVVIAVDGGGSGCRAVLWRAGCDPVLAAGGPANVTTDRQAAYTALADLLGNVIERAGLSKEALTGARVHLALAGYVDQRLDGKLADRLKLTRFSISDDQVSTVVGALGENEGAVAGIGTGSFLAVQFGGQSRFSGGWGPVIGDHASGHWLGRNALEQTLLAQDGLIARTALTQAVLDRHGGDPVGLVHFARDASQAGIASLAPLVVSHARSGDAVAQELMRRGARYITDGLTALGWKPGLRLCLTGGLGPEYGAYLSEETQAGLTAPEGTALDGALRLARRG